MLTSDKQNQKAPVTSPWSAGRPSEALQLEAQRAAFINGSMSADDASKFLAKLSPADRQQLEELLRAQSVCGE